MSDNPGFPGLGADCRFPTFEALIAYYSRLLPAPYVRNLIEAEKEIFVVRRDCTLQETYVQFLRKCESGLRRAAEDAEAGRGAWEWTHAGPAGGAPAGSRSVEAGF